nr:hypothetical protein GCM10020092_060230 [Actinoplanes digitatis]
MPDLDRVEYGLRPVHAREWLGYVWVCLSETPPSFAETVQGACVERLGDLASLERYGIEDLSLGWRIRYDVRANWKLIIENFMECYHCATIHPELVHVLPEFVGGYAAQYYVGHGAEFGPGIEGFTVDGGAGVTTIAGLAQEQDRRYFAVTIRPQVFLNLVPDHVILHRMYPLAPRPHGGRVRLALPAGGGRTGPRPDQFGRAVRPGQPPGLRGLRALPAGDVVPRVRRRRRAGAQRAPHRHLPRVAARPPAMMA